MLEPGLAAFDFKLEGSGGRSLTLSDFQGRWVVLFFYPKDSTKG